MLLHILQYYCNKRNIKHAKLLSESYGSKKLTKINKKQPFTLKMSQNTYVFFCFNNNGVKYYLNVRYKYIFTANI